MMVCMTLTLGCSTPKKSSPPAALKGFGISPLGFPLDYSKTTGFFAEVGGMKNGAVLWNAAWRDDVVNGTDSGTIPAGTVSLEQAASTYHFTPLFVFGWRSGNVLYLNVPSNPVNNWTNTDAQALFRSMLVQFASAYKPPYLFLGNENDSYYEQDPADYANWIKFYNSAYDAIKSVSPQTMVGPVFNYEHLSGSGVLNGWTQPTWQALDEHDLTRVDIVGITLYPWLNYASADAVPANYLDPLLSHIGSKPIAVTETGWPAENLGGLNPPWETSETAQVTYLSKLSAMLSGKNVKLVDWLFLNPMVDPGGSPVSWELFGSVSVRNSTGGKRAVYDPWISTVL